MDPTSARRAAAWLITLCSAAALGVATTGTAAAQGVGPTFAAAADATITPGALMVTQVDRRTTASCTADFVFRSTTTIYLGFAAHCAGADESMGHSGCDEPTLPLGTPVAITGTDGEQSRGTLAYSSWHAMQEQRETDESLCMYNDLALVALDTATIARVNPSMPLLGGPVGLAATGPTPGEAVYSYQPNNGGDGLRRGEAVADAGGGLTHRVQTEPPGGPGDSGGGYLDADGRAFGVLSTQFFDGPHTNGVTDLAAALSYADRFGALGTVTLVPGTEPFEAGARST
ncbi:serine protease [Pseudonocardia sp. GCM10023141]|uniref:serine protease n=1 Tax=Pseudonocardia sp. GCM10023141 TaxID=3252653 RepID=UPI003621EF52